MHRGCDNEGKDKDPGLDGVDSGKEGCWTGWRMMDRLGDAGWMVDGSGGWRVDSRSPENEGTRGK